MFCMVSWKVQWLLKEAKSPCWYRCRRTQTDRYTDRQVQRQTGTQTNIQTGRQTKRERDLLLCPGKWDGS